MWIVLLHTTQSAMAATNYSTLVSVEMSHVRVPGLNVCYSSVDFSAI